MGGEKKQEDPPMIARVTTVQRETLAIRVGRVVEGKKGFLKPASFPAALCMELKQLKVTMQKSPKTDISRN